VVVPKVTDGDQTKTVTTGTATTPAEESDGGMPWWGWVLIAVGVAAIVIGIRVLRRRKDDEPPDDDQSGSVSAR